MSKHRKPMSRIKRTALNTLGAMALLVGLIGGIACAPSPDTNGGSVPVQDCHSPGDCGYADNLSNGDQ